MQNIKIFILALGLFFVTACGDESNPNLPDLERVAVPKFTITAGSLAEIDANVISNFKGSFDLGVYFTDDALPVSTDLIIAKDGDYKNLKTLKEGITSLPTKVEFTGDDLVKLFGVISGGSFFEIGAQMKSASGFVVKPFNSNGTITYPGDIKNFPGSNPTIRYATFCAFKTDNFVGDFIVVADEWQDYKAGDVIAVSKVSENVLSFKYNCGPDALPILLNVNATTLRISGDKQEYCAYSLPPLTKFFGNIVEGDKSFIDGCTTTINVRIDHTDANAAAYGAGNIVLKKK